MVSHIATQYYIVRYLFDMAYSLHTVVEEKSVYQEILVYQTGYTVHPSTRCPIVMLSLLCEYYLVHGVFSAVDNSSDLYKL